MYLGREMDAGWFFLNHIQANVQTLNKGHTNGTLGYHTAKTKSTE